MPKQIIVVGAGYWGSSWLEYIDQSVDWELASLVSRGGPPLERERARWKLKESQCHTSFERALEGPGDVVVITVPHHLHLCYARSALAAGKSVLIEKPLSDDFDDARRFAKEAKDAAPGAWVSQNYRYCEGLWRLRQSLAAGSLGRLLSIRLNFRRPGKKKPAGPRVEWRKAQWSFLLNEIVIHHFDMCRFLSGSDAMEVFCAAWKQPWHAGEGPESAAAAIRFEDGWTLSFDGHTRALCGPGTEFSGDWLVQTDLGCAVWRGDDVIWEAAEGETAELAPPAGFPGPDRAGVLAELSNALDGGRAVALPTVEDNLRSLAMVEAAIRSVRENRVIALSEVLNSKCP